MWERHQIDPFDGYRYNEINEGDMPDEGALLDDDGNGTGIAQAVGPEGIKTW